METAKPLALYHEKVDGMNWSGEYRPDTGFDDLWRLESSYKRKASCFCQAQEHVPAYGDAFANKQRDGRLKRLKTGLTPAPAHVEAAFPPSEQCDPRVRGVPVYPMQEPDVDADSDYVFHTLDTVRSVSDPEEVTAEQCRVLECAMDSLWDRILVAPFATRLTDREFALFNYFRRARYHGSPLAALITWLYWERRGCDSNTKKSSKPETCA
ncbi:hypothetical protein KEM52_000562 [Ascosphaera acerosa]|nr:hypothetical protein KEM52_000562 [Ascosphaera acerosa]